MHENRCEAEKIVNQWLAGLNSGEAEAILTAHYVACGVVMAVDEAVRQPQVEERDLVVAVIDPTLGEISVVSSAFKYSQAASGVSGLAPTLGQHNHTILIEWLAYDEKKIAQLAQVGVLKSGGI